MMLYIHIPFCAHKCNYCDFLSFDNKSYEYNRYVDALCDEILFYGNKLSHPNISSIYIGGGTPSILPSPLIEKIINTCVSAFAIEPDCEISIECNPNTAGTYFMSACASFGINRVSIGLQSTLDDELSILGRIHSYGDFIDAYQNALSAGIRNINVDVMTNIPYQTADKVASTLKKIIRLKPSHISVYGLQIEEGTCFFNNYQKDYEKKIKGIKTSILPDEIEEEKIADITKKMLSDSGYLQYEISNYSKPNMECKHNVGYWKRTPYLGVGLGASSFYNSNRYKNPTDFDTYYNLSSNDYKCDTTALSRYDEMAEFFFLGLRMLKGVSEKDFYDTFSVSCDHIYENVFDKLINEGLLERNNQSICLTPLGLNLSNYALSNFIIDEGQ